MSRPPIGAKMTPIAKKKGSIVRGVNIGLVEVKTLVSVRQRCS